MPDERDYATRFWRPRRPGSRLCVAGSSGRKRGSPRAQPPRKFETAVHPERFNDRVTDSSLLSQLLKCEVRRRAGEIDQAGEFPVKF